MPLAHPPTLLKRCCFSVAETEASPSPAGASSAPGSAKAAKATKCSLTRHSGSFHGKPRGSRLARRARSFKDDFLEILSQMRSPGGGGGGASGGSATSRSPQSPKSRTPIKNARSDEAAAASRNPLQDLDAHVRQVRQAGRRPSGARAGSCFWCVACGFWN